MGQQRKRHFGKWGICVGSIVLIVGGIWFAQPYNRPVWTVTDHDNATAADTDPIKWVNFDIPHTVLQRAMEYDIQSQGSNCVLNWIDLLSVLGAQYGGDFSHYRPEDLMRLVTRLQSGESMAQITVNMPQYSYYTTAYGAVLSGFLGEYSVCVPNEGGELAWEKRYGLKVYAPIAGGYYYDHYDDFCAERTYGYDRKHLGHDLMCSVGTPIVAVESGVVEELGWNEYGGWRVGIRSFDGKRYYYYAHMRQNRPYHPNVTIGTAVKAGDVIGYVGRTGYSPIENTNNIAVNHLHWGMQLVFDESEKDGTNQIWIDLYELTLFLAQHRSPTIRVSETKEHYRKYDYTDPQVEAFLRGEIPLPYPNAN